MVTILLSIDCSLLALPDRYLDVKPCYNLFLCVSWFHVPLCLISVVKPMMDDHSLVIRNYRLSAIICLEIQEYEAFGDLQFHLMEWLKKMLHIFSA